MKARAGVSSGAPRPDLNVPAPLLQALLDAAREARERAYAPYSGFKVGSAVATGAGTLFRGCNVENASYGLTSCAERTALFTAVASGCPGFQAVKPLDPAREITHLAVMADTDAPLSPCGACRQVMIELGGPALIVIQANLRGSVAVTTAGRLLPGAFTLLPAIDPHIDPNGGPEA